MINGDFQYLSDSLLIDRLFLLDRTINKQAGVADGLLGSIGGSIMAWAKEHVDTTSGISGIMSSLSDIMIPGILFKINPILGGLGSVAQVLGFSPTSIIKKIMQFLYTTLNNGRLPTLDEINNVGKSAVAAEAGSITAEANMFDLLHLIEKKGKLVLLIRLAQYRSSQTTPKIPFFGGDGNIIERIFGELFKVRAKGKAKWLLGGFIVWIIKTILLGAGLVAGAEKITSLFDGAPSKTPEPSNQEENKEQELDPYAQDKSRWVSYTQPVSSIETETTSEIKLTPTGRGQDIHQNDHKTSTWVVPMVNRSVEDTLLAWAGDIYKEFIGKEQLIASTDSFNKIVDELRHGLDSSNSNQLTIPPKYKSRKQIVDKFASEAASKL